MKSMSIIVIVIAKTSKDMANRDTLNLNILVLNSCLQKDTTNKTVPKTKNIALMNNPIKLNPPKKSLQKWFYCYIIPIVEVN